MAARSNLRLKPLHLELPIEDRCRALASGEVHPEAVKDECLPHAEIEG